MLLTGARSNSIRRAVMCLCRSFPRFSCTFPAHKDRDLLPRSGRVPTKREKACVMNINSSRNITNTSINAVDPIYEFISTYIQNIPELAQKLQGWHLANGDGLGVSTHTRLSNKHGELCHLHTLYMRLQGTSTDPIYTNISEIKRIEIAKNHLYTHIHPKMNRIKNRTRGMTLEITRKCFRNRKLVQWTYVHLPELFANALIAMYRETTIENGCWIIGKCDGVVEYPSRNTRYRDTQYPGVYIPLDKDRVLPTHLISMTLRGKGRVCVPNNYKPNSEIYIRHECANKQCWNPRHLKYGTHDQNMNDKRIFADPAKRVRAGRRNSKTAWQRYIASIS